MQIPPALKERGFRFLWFGLFFYITGSQMQTMTLHWHLRTLTDDPTAVSMIGLARFLPVLLLAPLGGVVADSFNRRKILFFTQSLMLFTSFSLGLLTWLGVTRLWHIYLFSVLQYVAISFDLPARQALMPNLVPRSLYPNAFSMQSIASNTGAIVGPALGGLVLAYFGLHVVYWLNAFALSVMLFMLVSIGPVEQKYLPLAGLGSVFSSIREGVRFIKGEPLILSSMLLDFVATFFSSATTLLPFVAVDLLKVGEVQYGWLATGEALGALTVALIFSQRLQVRRQGPLLLAAVFVYGLATALVGFSRSFWLTLFALMLVGAGDSVSTILRNTIRQSLTPDTIRGRMVSLNQVFFQGGPQLGEMEGGLVAGAFGIPASIVSGGLGCVLGAALIALRWPQLRRHDRVEQTA